MDQKVGTRPAEGAALSLSSQADRAIEIRGTWASAERHDGEVPPIHARRSKRAFDIVGSLLALILLSPLFVLMAVAVCVSDRGPVFFRQVRVGADGRHFRMVKFRSMRVDAEDLVRSNEELYRRYLENDCKLEPHEDSRFTAIGRFIRGTSLDELPQLWNVLKGDMSLVGPRPVLPAQLRQSDPVHYLHARPGITGLWQISGRSRLTYAERVRLDTSYIEQWHLGRDLQILLRTPRAVLAGDGAH